MVFHVRGQTCRDCNPHRPAVVAPARGTRRVTIVPTHPSGAQPRIETLSEDLSDKSAAYLPERIIGTAHHEPPTEATERTNLAWREAVEPIATAVFGETDWQVVERLWQPRHGEALEAVAEAFDEVWTSVVPMADESTVILRVAGLDPIAAGLALHVTERSAKTDREPIPLTGEVIRYIAVICDAGTEHAVMSGWLRYELEGVPEVPDKGVVRLLGTELPKALTATPSELSLDLTIDTFLPGLHRQYERVTIEAEPPIETPGGPIKLTQSVTAGAFDGPSSAATFGDS